MGDIAIRHIPRQAFYVVKTSMDLWNDEKQELD